MNRTLTNRLDALESNAPSPYRFESIWDVVPVDGQPNPHLRAYDAATGLEVAVTPELRRQAMDYEDRAAKSGAICQQVFEVVQPTETLK